MNETIKEIIMSMEEKSPLNERLEILQRDYFNNEEFSLLSIIDRCEVLSQLWGRHRFGKFHFSKSNDKSAFNEAATELFLLLYLYLDEENSQILLNCIQKWERNLRLSQREAERRRKKDYDI